MNVTCGLQVTLRWWLCQPRRRWWTVDVEVVSPWSPRLIALVHRSPWSVQCTESRSCSCMAITDPRRLDVSNANKSEWIESQTDTSELPFCYTPRLLSVRRSLSPLLPVRLTRMTLIDQFITNTPLSTPRQKVRNNHHNVSVPL